MPWWGWVTVGTLLLVAEMLFVDLEFYLVFLGVSALLVGLVGVAGFEMPFWIQWLVFAVLSIASLVIFRQRVYAVIRPPPDGEIRSGVEGERATALDSIAPGATGSVTLRGANWTGLNRGHETIPAGARCRVERSEGVVLELRLDD
jgi:membrane protein implicated in regulation of membrane protease activity